MFRAVWMAPAQGDVVKCESHCPVEVPAAVVSWSAQKRPLSPIPVDIRNGETKMARMEQPPALQDQIRAIELLQERMHGEEPFVTLWPVFSRIDSLVNALDRPARTLLEAQQAGRPLSQAQPELLGAAMELALRQSGLFERVTRPSASGDPAH
jgi:hypothetical protein